MTPGFGQPAPTVSVLIAAYNAAAFLPRAVESARAQGLAALEILVVDDASTDETATVAQGLAVGAPPVRVITLARNGGPAAARNAGLDAARGDWVAVLDADDAFEPDHLATLVAAADAGRADVVLANFVYFDPVADRAGATGIPAGEAAFATDAAGYVDHCRPLRAESDWGLLKPLFCAAFLRDRGIRYPTGSRHGEDFLLVAEALLAGARVAVSPRPTYRYTHRGVGWSRTRIDYGATIADSRRLAADPRVAGDPALVAALDARVTALTRWQAQQTADWLLSRRRYAALVRHALTDRDVRATLIRRLSPRRADPVA